MKKFCAFISVALALIMIFPSYIFADKVTDDRSNAADDRSADDIHISADCATLYSYDTKKFIYNKNANIRHSMASTTKIMTALIAIENSSMEDIVTVDSRAVGIEGSSVYLRDKETISMENLLYALLLQSANDAAAAIAYDIAGSIESFADMMNEKALELGAKDTHFTNPHGLDDDNHYTTAQDLAKIAAAALSDETFRNIVSCRQKTITSDDGEIVRVLINHNKMLRIYDGAFGVKTGYTKKTGRCLVSCAERDGVTLICVTLDAPDDWDDHACLLDFGFTLLVPVKIANEGEIRFAVEVLNGDKAEVTVANSDALSVVLPKNDENVTVKTDINKTLIAPIKKGDVLGRLNVYKDGRLCASSALIATENIKAKK